MAGANIAPVQSPAMSQDRSPHPLYHNFTVLCSPEIPYRMTHHALFMDPRTAGAQVRGTVPLCIDRSGVLHLDAEDPTDLPVTLTFDTDGQIANCEVEGQNTMHLIQLREEGKVQALIEVCDLYNQWAARRQGGTHLQDGANFVLACTTPYPHQPSMDRWEFIASRYRSALAILLKQSAGNSEWLTFIHRILKLAAHFSGLAWEGHSYLSIRGWLSQNQIQSVLTHLAPQHFPVFLNANAFTAVTTRYRLNPAAYLPAIEWIGGTWEMAQPGGPESELPTTGIDILASQEKRLVGAMAQCLSGRSQAAIKILLDVQSGPELTPDIARAYIQARHTYQRVRQAGGDHTCTPFIQARSILMKALWNHPLFDLYFGEFSTSAMNQLAGRTQMQALTELAVRQG